MVGCDAMCRVAIGNLVGFQLSRACKLKNRIMRHRPDNIKPSVSEGDLIG